MKIDIVPYNYKWPYFFKKIKCELKKNIIQNDITIKHIGSTSVKGLAAKPIIDILIGITSQDLDNYIEPIKNLGFTYIKEYEKETPNRRFFFLEKNKKRLAHIHLVKINSRWFKRHIAFRNELRSNKITREKYQTLKYKLSEKEWLNGNEYAHAKTGFIKSIEKMLNFN